MHLDSIGYYEGRRTIGKNGNPDQILLVNVQHWEQMMGFPTSAQGRL